MITTTNKDSNYLAKIVELKNSDFREHPNADKLHVTTVDFMHIITSKDNKAGTYIYFPENTVLSHELLYNLNLYRNKKDEKSLNKDLTKSGFFEKDRRLKAINLRGVKSFGILVPIKEISDIYLDNKKVFEDNINQYFDSINGELIVEKYNKPEVKKKGVNLGHNKIKGKFNRLLDHQVKLHENTANIRKHINNIDINSNITISYKYHGTSGWASNILVKRNLNWFERLLNKFGVNIQQTKYDLIYGSRKVIKNKYLSNNSNHYYGYDLWKDMVDKYDLANKLPKGYSIYYEIVGFTKEGKYIQKSYDYGCESTEAKILVYKVTYTNSDGKVYYLNTKEAKTFTERIGLKFVQIYYSGTLKNWIWEKDAPFSRLTSVDLISMLEQEYNGNKCHICNNEVPTEGVVIRVENNYKFEAYKLKDKQFILNESNE